MLKSKIYNILWITVAWTFISMFQYLIGYAISIQFGYQPLGEELMAGWAGGLVTGITAGTIGGSIIVFFWEKWLRSKPYGWTLRNILITYSIAFLAISYISTLYFASNHPNIDLGNNSVWLVALKYSFQPNILIPYSVWLLIVMLTLITMLVNDKYGPGVFIKFLMGKYFNPKREERVFMFMDLRSSTSIAEKLGEEQYFNFIKEVYKVVTPAILKNKGEIYQYVGDEIVISWPVKTGIENGNCINCYFDVKRLLHRKEIYFLKKYGVQPEFKAGLHYGSVMAGEIGIVKRDIAYSGDVLNTTSRIQEMCNALKVDILLSDSLIKRIDFNKLKIQTKSMGEVNLRGKSNKVEIFSI